MCQQAEQRAGMRVWAPLVFLANSARTVLEMRLLLCPAQVHALEVMKTV